MHNYRGSFARPLMSALMIVFTISAVVADKYVWEAENVGKLTGKAFKVRKYVNDPVGKVSQDKVIMIDKVLPGKKVEKDSVNYRVNIPVAGKFYLWARVCWTTGCGNSFYLTVNGSRDHILGGDGTYDSLHWIGLKDVGKPLAIKLPKGISTFTLKSREGGTRVDQFLLTNDPKMIPASYYTSTAKLISIDSPAAPASTKAGTKRKTTSPRRTK